MDSKLTTQFIKKHLRLLNKVTREDLIIKGIAKMNREEALKVFKERFELKTGAATGKIWYNPKSIDGFRPDIDDDLLKEEYSKLMNKTRKPREKKITAKKPEPKTAQKPKEVLNHLTEKANSIYEALIKKIQKFINGTSKITQPMINEAQGITENVNFRKEMKKYLISKGINETPRDFMDYLSKQQLEVYDKLVNQLSKIKEEKSNKPIVTTTAQKPEPKKVKKIIRKKK